MLQNVDISRNSIGDDGISAISDSLHVNTTLIQLVARSCKFHTKGAESIAEMLLTNKTLKYLNVSGNHIEDDGITVVICSIRGNATLNELLLYGCKFNSKALENVNKMLMVKNSLKSLGIACTDYVDGYDYYHDDGDDDDAALVVVIETFLKSNCKLSQLSISGKIKDCISKACHFVVTEFTGFTKHRYQVLINQGREDVITLKVWFVATQCPYYK